MMSLFNQEEIMQSYIKSERREERMDNARRLLKLGKIKMEDVTDCFPELTASDIQELESEFMQTV